MTETFELKASGLTDREISLATGVPVGTLRQWRKAPRRPERTAHEFDVSQLPEPAYAYLLGIYLGDGTLTQHARGVYRLVVALDSRYPLLIGEVAEAMEAVMPGKHAHRVLHPTAACVHVDMYSKHWPTIFPQHGPGRKHTRPIVLTSWQQAIVDEHPQEFLRGLIHSDGTRHINRVWHGTKSYEYARYNFTNTSADIRALFCASCDALGIAWRRMNATNISVARREAVAALDAFVGPKR